MIRLALADLRDSWLAWLGVSIAFVTLNFSLALSGIALTSAASSTSALGPDGTQLLRVDGIANIVLSSLVGLAVIGAATALVVTSRRGALARVLLAGATPAQVTLLVATQITAVALASSVVGSLLAVALAPTALRLVVEDRGLAGVDPTVSVPLLLGTAIGCALLCVIGGLRQAHAASAIPPVEALREATSGGTRPEGPLHRTLRALRFLLSVAALLVMFVFVGASGNTVATEPEAGKDLVSMITQQAFLAVPVAGLALTAILPWIVGPVTRAWTGALPIRSASWHLARHTVLAKRGRLIRSIVPVMFSVGLVFGLMAVGATFAGIAEHLGVGQLEGSSATSLLTLVGLPLAVAVAGAVGNLVMMSRQRSAELALDGVIGATPRQQILIPIFEALIITLTASILGLIMATVGGSLLALGLSQVLPQAQLVMPWALLAGSVLACLIVVTAATTGPIIRSLGAPAPTVISRFIAT